MKTPERLKELRVWLATAAVLGLLVLAYFSLRTAEADRRHRAPSADLAADLRLMWETEPLRVPPDWTVGAHQRASTDRAIDAASRVFNTVELVGKTRAEVVALLGDSRTASDSIYNDFPFWPAPRGALVYRFSTV